jgi:hypothetical protein
MADEQKSPDGMTRAELYQIFAWVFYAIFVVYSDAGRRQDRHGIDLVFGIVLMVALVATAITCQVRALRGRAFRISPAAVVLVLVFWSLLAVWLIMGAVHL